MPSRRGHPGVRVGDKGSLGHVIWVSYGYPSRGVHQGNAPVDLKLRREAWGWRWRVLDLLIMGEPILAPD